MTNTKCIIEVSIWDMYNYVCIYTKTGRKHREMKMIHMLELWDCV